VKVTELMIRNAMRGAPLLSQQAGGISLPRIQQFVDRLLAGEVAPAIKVDGVMIVDGNHGYIASRIAGLPVAIQPWAGGRPSNAVPWNDLRIDENFW
jgi:hypothetical protein